MIKTIPFYELNEEQKKKIWVWRNDERLRVWMKNPEKITWESHLSFIESLKDDTKRKYWLVISGGREVGTINLHKKDSYRAEGGLYKKPDIHIPIGHILIKALEIEAKKYGFQRIILEVKYKNTKAIRLYEKNGYKVYWNSEDFLLMDKLFLHSVQVVAELSANHNHSLETAKETLQAASESGADAVKIQTYTADTMTILCNNKYFQINQGTPWDGRNLYDLYKEAYTPWEWHDELRDYAESLGLIFFSTPFDFSAVDFLEEKSVPLYKIASFEITDIPLIKYIASKGKPMIISTGIASAGDIQLAVDTCRRAGNDDITLLQCVSSYPAPVELANLRMIPNLAETFGVKSGLSDHTLGTACAVAAVALGARMIEKHFILDRSIGGPDAMFSTEPDEFKDMVDDIRIVEKALGKVDYSLTENKKNSRKFARSLFVVENMNTGDQFTEKNIRSIRPGDGLHPQYLQKILGKKAARDLKRGEPLSWDVVVG